MPSSKPGRRLLDIVENIDRILAYTAGMSEADFLRNGLTHDAVERCLQRISEAATKLGRVAEDRIPQQTWSDIRSMGNILRHEYDRVDSLVVWTVVTDRLPKLREDVLDALHELDRDESGV